MHTDAMLRHIQLTKRGSEPRERLSITSLQQRTLYTVVCVTINRSATTVANNASSCSLFGELQSGLQTAANFLSVSLLAVSFINTCPFRFKCWLAAQNVAEAACEYAYCS